MTPAPRGEAFGWHAARRRRSGLMMGFWAAFVLLVLWSAVEAVLGEGLGLPRTLWFWGALGLLGLVLEVEQWLGRRGPQVVVGPEGMWFRRLGPLLHFVPARDVLWAHERRGRFGAHLTVGTRRRGGWLARISRVRRFIVVLSDLAEEERFLAHLDAQRPGLLVRAPRFEGQGHGPAAASGT